MSVIHIFPQQYGTSVHEPKICDEKDTGTNLLSTGTYSAHFEIFRKFALYSVRLRNK